MTVCLIPPMQCGRSTPRTGEWCGVECTLVGVWGCVYTDWSLLEVDHPTEAHVLRVLGHFVCGPMKRHKVTFLSVLV